MYKVKTLNAISPVYETVLNMEDYAFDAYAENPDAIMVRSANMHEMDIPASVQCVARAGAGVNNIPLDKLAERGVVVFNSPGANANAVKELVITGMLLASRKVVDGVEWCKTLSGKGAEVEKLVEKGKSQFVGPELQGKTLGVVGLGAIGVLVANAGVALGMSVTVAQTLGADGAMVRNIVLFGVLIYELVGPALTRIALTEAGDIQPKAEAVVSADD